MAILLGTDGIGWLVPAFTAASFENLDVAMAVGYPFVALSRRARSPQAEAAMQAQALLRPRDTA